MSGRLLKHGRVGVCFTFAAIFALVFIARPAFAEKKPNEMVMLDTLYQLCSLRQREILALNKLAIEETIKYNKSKDEASKPRTLLAIRSSKDAAERAEISWQRLNCFEYMYRSQQQVSR